MVNTCANPKCGSPFRYWRAGRLYAVEAAAQSAAGKPTRNVEYFWLCEQCSQTMTVRCRRGSAPELVAAIDARGENPCPPPIAPAA